MATEPKDDLPRATCASIGLVGKPKNDSDESKQHIAELIREADAYLADFATGPECPGCGSRLVGICGVFRWHDVLAGEGYCGECTWPCRGQHACGSGTIFEAVLPYHPSVVAPVSQPV